MSHQPRGPNYQDGEYIPTTVGGETIVPIQGPGATGTSSRLRRSASVEHNPDSLAAEKPPPGTRSTQPAPAFVRDDNFFNEKITLPRLAVNEREHITAEDYDNEDRGSLDNEEQSYDRQVRYSQSRSGSLPPRRFQDQRSSYFDWSTAPRSQYFESSTHGTTGGGQLAGAPWVESEQKHQLQSHEAGEQQQFAKQTTHQTAERSHSEAHNVHRNYYGGHSRRARYSGGGHHGYSEGWHEGDGEVAPYYRPEHTSTLRGAESSSKAQRHAALQSQAALQQQQQYAAGGASSYSHHHHQRSAAASGGGRGFGQSQSFGYRSGGAGGGYYKDGGYYKERKYHKVRCCCFPCIWPPYAYEEAPPPRPMYYSGKPPPPL